MGQFDQFANQGGAAAWDPEEAAKAKRDAEEHLKNADYAGELPEPLGSATGRHAARPSTVADEAGEGDDGEGPASDDAVAGSTESDSTGSDDTGSDDTGSDGTGSDGTGSDHTEQGDTSTS